MSGEVCGIRLYRFLIIAFSSTLLVSFVITTAWVLMSDMEPQNYSRFDYECKVVQKQFELEHRRNEQQAINKALEIELENAKTITEERKSE